MKTSELTGAALDWAVAQCEGLDEREYVEIDNLYGAKWRGPEYSTDWAQGGPIIERECMEFDYDEGPQTYRAFNGINGAEGKTHLIAAMRCLVSSKLGDEIEVPEELL